MQRSNLTVEMTTNNANNDEVIRDRSLSSRPWSIMIQNYIVLFFFLSDWECRWMKGWWNDRMMRGTIDRMIKWSIKLFSTGSICIERSRFTTGSAMIARSIYRVFNWIVHYLILRFHDPSRGRFGDYRLSVRIDSLSWDRAKGIYMIWSIRWSIRLFGDSRDSLIPETLLIDYRHHVVLNMIFACSEFVVYDERLHRVRHRETYYLSLTCRTTDRRWAHSKCHRDLFICDTSWTTFDSTSLIQSVSLISYRHPVNPFVVDREFNHLSRASVALIKQMTKVERDIKQRYLNSIREDGVDLHWPRYQYEAARNVSSVWREVNYEKFWRNEDLQRST